MSDGPEWFAPKRYGYGSGVPVTWQGWALTLVVIAVALALGLTLGDQPLKLVAALIPVIAVFLAISARTTRGGWRWRWGEKQ